MYSQNPFGRRTENWCPLDSPRRYSRASVSILIPSRILHAFSPRCRVRRETTAATIPRNGTNCELLARRVRTPATAIASPSS
ncbi:hypothetical protein PM082_020701 [Marasmius tenuissimus]|nr:hypothetical protein PM082_020701 [Marasmius tenuissimus]